jgi:cytochrome P450
VTHFGAELRRMVNYFVTAIGRPTLGDFLLPAYLPTPLTMRRRRFRRRWVRLVSSIVAERRKQSRPDAPRDLFDLLSEAHGDGQEDLLIDEAATMIVAGHESTAMTLFWAALLLASAPDWQNAVAAEVGSLDLSPGKAAESLPALKLTQAVVQETLRLYPAAAITGRRVIKSDTVCGVDVRAGSLVLIPFWLLHRNPKFWPAPDMFDPGRFLTDAKPDRFVYLPFGVGPHTCIGAQLAMTEAVLVLAWLVQRFIIMRTDDRPVGAVNVLAITRPGHIPSFELRARFNRTGSDLRDIRRKQDWVI